MSLASIRLFDGDLVRISHVSCRPLHRCASDVERPNADTLVLPGRGVFVQHFSRTTDVLAEPTRALLFAAERPYRISHPDLGGDDCLSMEFSPGALREALVSTARVDRLHANVLNPHAVLPPAAMTARKLLWRRLADGLAGGLEVEETSLALLASVLASARREEKSKPSRPAVTARRRRQAYAVREMLLSAPAERWALGELARRVYTTPFHLARVFREEAGVSVHQYHLRVRLAAALDLLLDTDQGLATIALDLGFATHSHFTAAFQRMVGVAPDRLRRSCRGAQARQVRSALLERLGRDA
jgi:AraC family transcriptional regulator